jgi:hypothetical protein
MIYILFLNMAMTGTTFFKDLHEKSIYGIDTDISKLLIRMLYSSIFSIITTVLLAIFSKLMRLDKFFIKEIKIRKRVFEKYTKKYIIKEKILPKKLKILKHRMIALSAILDPIIKNKIEKKSNEDSVNEISIDIMMNNIKQSKKQLT